MKLPNEERSVREIALSYYDEHGWFVIPIDPREKRNYKDFRYAERYGNSLAPRKDVEEWGQWDGHGCRVGTRTGAVSGIFVLDIDSQEAHEYINRQGHPIAPIVQSPREGGGMHIYFKHPGFYVKNAVGLNGIEGLDIRGEGVIVVLPPSVDAKSGRSYEWTIPPSDVEPPPPPEWLLELLKKQSDMKQPLDVPEIMAGIPQGQRDSQLNRLAGKTRQMNLPQDTAEKLLEWAAQACNPPFNSAEARSKVRWVYTHYAPGEEQKVFFAEPQEEGEEEPRDEEGYLLPISLGALPKPGPREWLVEDLFPMKYPTTIYGTGGVAKSFLMLSLATALAAGEEEWMGMKINGGPVYYLDFELEVEEQTRRAYEIAKGMGYDAPPEKLYYQSAVGKGMVEAFNLAMHHCRELGIRFIVIDSTGLALTGDSESSGDVISFFREVVGGFTQRGICVGLIDHQGKLQGGERYQSKTAFGSAYKEHLTRSAIQVEAMSRNPTTGAISIRFRHRKTNFGRLVNPFEVEVSFHEDEVRLTTIELDEGELASEESLGAEERILHAVRHLGSATPPEVVDLTALALATVRKHFSLLKKHGKIRETGSLRDGAHVVELNEVVEFNPITPLHVVEALDLEDDDDDEGEDI